MIGPTVGDEDRSGSRRESDLWRRWSEGRDQAARAALVDLYMPVARRMARRYAGVAEPYDDLLQVASLGLLNAIDRFDPDNGTPFNGFAKPTIMGELKRYFRDKVWTVRLPRSLHDKLLRVERASEEMTLDLGRPPTVAELAAALELEPAEVVEALEAQHNRSALSLDAPSRSPGADDDGAALGEWLGEEDPGFGSVEDRQSLRAALPRLEERDAEILRLRFVDDLSQVEIAKRVGCSQMQVSRLLRRALDTLREQMRA
jgi:RNA polymerase sigma-B factor